MLINGSATCIELRKQYNSRWIRIYIAHDAKSTARLYNEDGLLLRTTEVAAGNNYIDITDLKEASLHVKLETPLETISKEINLQ